MGQIMLDFFKMLLSLPDSIHSNEARLVDTGICVKWCFVDFEKVDTGFIFGTFLQLFIPSLDRHEADPGSTLGRPLVKLFSNDSNAKDAPGIIILSLIICPGVDLNIGRKLIPDIFWAGPGSTSNLAIFGGMHPNQKHVKKIRELNHKRSNLT